MAITARGAKHAAYRCFETDYQTPPANPAFLMFRQGGFKLSVERDTLVSKEITDTRHVKNVVFGSKKVIGEVSGELLYGSHDDLLEAAIMGTWAPRATKTAITIAVDGDTNQITDSGNGFLTAGFAVGQRIALTGFTTAANNATRVATTVTAGAITFAGADGDTLVTEAAGDSVTVRTKEEILKTGSTSRSMVIERHFTDKDVLMRFDGVKIGKLGFKIAANGIAELTFSLIGSEGLLLSIEDDKIAGATYSESANTTAMTAARSVVMEDGVAIVSLSELSFDLDNEVEGEYVVGKDTSNEPTEGDSNLKGSATMFFKDTTHLEKWMTGEEDAFKVTFTDPAGNIMGFEIPRVALLGAAPDVSGKGSIPITTPFQAMLDATTATNIVVSRIPIL